MLRFTICTNQGDQQRATYPLWSMTVHSIRDFLCQCDEPVLYYLVDGPVLSFIREELMLVLEGT